MRDELARSNVANEGERATSLVVADNERLRYVGYELRSKHAKSSSRQWAEGSRTAMSRSTDEVDAVKTATTTEMRSNWASVLVGSKLAESGSRRRDLSFGSTKRLESGKV